MPITLETIVKSGTVSGPQGAQGASGAQGALGTPGTATNKQVLYNDGGVAAGTATLTWEKTTNELIVTGNLVSNTAASLQTTATISTNTLTIDVGKGTVFEVSLNANINTLTLTNVNTAGRTTSFVLVLVGDGTSRTINWPASFKFESGVAPSIASGSGKKTILTFFTYDAGTIWHGLLSGYDL